MGRLIDEDELIKGRVENDPVVIAAKSAPTAYDPDKVVEQLKNKMQQHKRGIEYEKKNGTVTEEFQQRKAVEVLTDAIEIVKGGGVDDNYVRAEDKGSVSQTDLEALIAKYEGYTKLNEEKPLETNSYENGENNVLLAVIADLKDMISRS